MSINNIIAGSRKTASRFFLFFIAFVGIISMTSCRESNDTEDEFENWEARNKEYFNNIYSKAETAIKSGDDSWKIIRVYSKDSISAKSKSDFIVAHVETEGKELVRIAQFTQTRFVFITEAISFQVQATQMDFSLILHGQANTIRSL